MKRTMALLMVVACTGLTPAQAEAGLGQLLRKGVELVTRGGGNKVVRETTEAGVKRGVAQVVPNGATKLVGRGIAALPVLPPVKSVVQKGATVGRKVMSASQTLADDLGREGVQAAKALSPAGAQKLAAVSADLAKSPHRQAWLTTIGKYGDSAAEFLWKRKGSVAVGTVAGVALLRPEEFLRSSGKVMETAIGTAGSQVIKPLVVTLGEHVAGPVATTVGKQAAASFPWRLLWFLLLTGLASCWAWRRWRPKQVL